MISFYYKSVKEKSLRKLEEFRIGSWVYVERPTEDELRALGEKFALDPGHLRDAIDPYEVPRVEQEGNATYVFVRYPIAQDDEILTAPILIVLGDDFLLTMCTKPFPVGERFLCGDLDCFTTQKIKLFLQILFQITHAYSSFLNRINRDIRRIAISLERIKNQDIVQFVTLERMLSDFLSALLPTHTMLQNLLSGKIFQLYKEDQDLIEDIFLTKGQLTEMCRSDLKLIGNIRSAYTTIMSNNLNKVMKLLTSLTILFTIPTMIASLFGMNVRVPFEDAPQAFFGIIAFIIVISAVLVGVFIRNRWL